MTGVAEPTTQAVLYYSAGIADVVPIGTELIMDIGGCDTRAVTDPAELTTWATLLAEKTGMQTYGDAIIAEFGEGNLHGPTVIQMITTSDLRIHAFPRHDGACLNFFSCGPYDPEQALAFTVDFFGAKTYSAYVLPRVIPRTTPERTTP
jgi:S-adenosylmethionine/arginine decarboxylase-like enzyme